MLIATAGHVDHGKTSLVRALTGVETDRLPEEKARGMSIDLGFAYWRPDGGETIGFVDVPGHERFLRNMIAGLSGIGTALIVVAADDGVMPQTREHVRILDLLGIQQALVAVTKVDMAEAARTVQVRQEMEELLAGTGMAGAPVFEVSSLTAQGIAELGFALLGLREDRPADPDHNFRLSIDRVFSVPGSGTVVTGTVLAGQARVEDRLVLAPLGREVRVRGMQSAGERVEAIGPGERCAVNLSRVEVSDIHRGDWLVAAEGFAPSSRIDARVIIGADCKRPLRHDSRVHLHIGTADLGARILMPRQKSVQPGAPADVTLVLDTPTHAVSGDRFILRDSSGRELLGGGLVLDPFASDRRRTIREKAARAAALVLDAPADKLDALAAAPGIEPGADWFARACNLSPAAMDRLVEDRGLVPTGKSGIILLTPKRRAALQDRVVEALSDHHARHPAQGGLTLRMLRNGLGEPVSPDLFAGLVNELASQGRIEVQGALARLPGHAAAFSDAESTFWRKALDWLQDRGAVTLTAAEIARDQRLGEPAVQAMLERRRASGNAWQITESKFMTRDHVAALVALAAELDAASGKGFTAAALRDASGIGRNFLIQLLEFFDRIGVTRRIGEARRMRGDWQAVVGISEPWQKPAA